MFGFVRLKLLQRKYRKLNSHNCTCIMNLCDISKIVVGKKSYGNIILSEGSLDDYKLIIGNYCSIAPNVVFLLANEHNLSSISTYPFKALVFGMGREAKGKGDIIIADDVWIGYGAIICSGISIGRGAVIGAGAVVTKDVEPYSVVAGNPAHFIKYRFEKNIIQQLLELNICQLFDSFSKEDVPLIYNDLDEKIIEQLQNRTNNSK